MDDLLLLLPTKAYFRANNPPSSILLYRRSSCRSVNSLLFLKQAKKSCHPVAVMLGIPLVPRSYMFNVLRVVFPTREYPMDATPSLARLVELTSSVSNAELGLRRHAANVCQPVWVMLRFKLKFRSRSVVVLFVTNAFVREAIPSSSIELFSTFSFSSLVLGHESNSPNATQDWQPISLSPRESSNKSLCPMSARIISFPASSPIPLASTFNFRSDD
mmetsp:Transcript_25959/g.54831  ORF Transcript_25959/g.54831 Transcript_25959/m.54831 type:complete len:217 (-) Transcript_25959:21-671(-)